MSATAILDPKVVSLKYPALSGLPKSVYERCRKRIVRKRFYEQGKNYRGHQRKRFYNLYPEFCLLPSKLRRRARLNKWRRMTTAKARILDRLTTERRAREAMLHE